MTFLQSEPGAEPIVVEGYFAASPERVFRAWTDPDAVRHWFGIKPNSLHSAEIDLRIGGAWRFLHSSDDVKTVGFEGEYQVIQPGERLVFSWRHVITHESGSREETPPSLVEIEFAPKGKGCMVRLIHSNIVRDDARKGVGGGWESSFGSLEAYLGKAG